MNKTEISKTHGSSERLKEIGEPQESSRRSAYRCCIEAAWRVGIGYALRELRQHLSLKWYIWREAFRSFCGHIRTQSAIGRPSVITGPWFECHGGRRRPNRRTLSRSVYIRKLQATHTWVDSQDCQMFLMGFDAGEEWSGRSADQVEEFLVENS
jgi:hypothetical protein